MTPLELTGRAQTHIVQLADPVCAIHAHAAMPFLNLRRAATAAGFSLEAVSSFRDFDRQLSIWNRKFCGALPLYAADGSLLDALQLSPEERVSAILLWSALPGASRHHWGTDLDLVDAAAPPGIAARLTEAEFAESGPFAPLAAWLEDNAAHFGFFRPFRGILSGVAPEPWHFSFAPVAERARHDLDRDVLAAALERTPLEGKEYVMPRLGEFHARYIAAIDWP